MRPAARPTLRALVLGLLLAAPSCRTGARLTDEAGGGAGPAGAPYAAPSAEGAVVQLSAADLAPVDAWVSTRNPQWILGDEVEVVASREYFAAALTVNAPTSGIVVRNDEVTPDEKITTLRFRGATSQIGIMTSPRVQIGTGCTVTARRVLRVRLQRTQDPAVPVRILVTAKGDAVRGSRQQVLEKGPLLTTGGALRRRGGGYVWEPAGR